MPTAQGSSDRPTTDGRIPNRHPPQKQFVQETRVVEFMRPKFVKGGIVLHYALELQASGFGVESIVFVQSLTDELNRQIMCSHQRLR